MLWGIPNAAGCSIKDKNLFAFHQYANEALKDIDFNENFYDVDIERKAVDSDIEKIIFDIDKYKFLYGQDIDEPLIYIKDINITKNDIKIMGKNSDTVKIEKFGIAYMKFHAKDFIQELDKYDDIKLEVVGRPNLNEWMGNYTPQIFIENYQIEDGSLSF